VTIICIDDDPAVRALNARALVKAGFRVYSGGKAIDAIELAKNVRDLALVLLDINLPGASGFDALQVMKANPSLRDVPVLMLSATTDPQGDGAKARKFGAAGLLSYPVTDAVLVEEVRKVVDPKRLPRMKRA
jgi:CheY-like chemotaxis protein